MDFDTGYLYNSYLFGALQEIIQVEMFKDQSDSQSSAPNNEIVGCTQERPQVQCEICQTQAFQDAFINPLGCHEFCKGCVETYLHNQIIDAKVFDIKCPNEQCTKYFIDVESLIDDEQIIKKYHYFKNRQMLEQDPFIRFCPKLECDKYVQYDGIFKIIQCECGTQICVDCSLEAHPDKNCREVEIILDSATRKQCEIKKCPGCSVLIQKNGGCSHIQCKKCNYQFCWNCMGYIGNNSANIVNQQCACVIQQIPLYRNDDMIGCEQCVHFMKQAVILLSIILCYLIMAPFALVITAYNIPQCYIENDIKWYQKIINFLVCIALLPLTIPYVILAAPYGFISDQC